MQPLRLITFDLDNTLWPVREVIERAELASSHYLQQRFPELAEALSVPALHLLRDLLVKARRDYLKNLTQLRTDTLEAALTDAGIPTTEARQATADAFEVFYVERNRVSFYPGALDLLDTLGKHFTLGALSNGNANLERIGIAHLFAFHHNAESVGEAKPHPAVFQAALASAGCHAEQALHIGDHPLEDIAAARRAGFRSCWANLDHSSWPSNLPAADYQVTQLAEIAPLLLHS